MTDEELENALHDRRQELFNLRFQSATGALENSARLKLAKREIARILTVRHEREGPVTCPDVEPSLPVIGHVEGEHRRNGLPEPPARREVSDAEPEMIDRRPADGVPEAGAGLGAIAFRIEEEAAVVVRVVFRPETRLPVAAVAGRGTRLPERVDVLLRRRRERDVEPARERRILEHEELETPCRPPVAVVLLDAKRGEH